MNKGKKSTFLILFLLGVLLFSVCVSAWEPDPDDCVNCEEKTATLFHKLYCKPFTVYFSELTGKLSFTAETKTHDRHDLQRFVFYNASVEDAGVLDENREMTKLWGHWVNVYYTVDPVNGHCCIMWVECAELNGGDVALPSIFLLIFVVIFVVLILILVLFTCFLGDL